LEPNGGLQFCHHVNGNFVLIPRSVYQVIGGLDSFFPHAIGDFDYALRAKSKNISCLLSSYYSGICEKHSSLPEWCLPEVPFLKRLKVLYSPLGSCHPLYFFIFELRHYGIGVALKHLFSIHLRVVFPHLWKKIKSNFNVFYCSVAVYIKK